MALTSALFTGLSGLDVNQARLQVVGNNIANTNTVAFKSSRALFKPQFYVTENGGTPPNGDFGGTNPSQRGLGAVVSSIEKDFSTGAIEPTGKPTDMAIDGDGFFVVQGDGQTYTFRNAVGAPVKIRTMVMTNVPTDELEVAGAMADKGCNAQLDLLANLAQSTQAGG